MLTLMTKDVRLPARSTVVFGQSSSISPEMMGYCPGVQDLNVLHHDWHDTTASALGHVVAASTAGEMEMCPVVMTNLCKTKFFY